MNRLYKLSGLLLAAALTLHASAAWAQTYEDTQTVYAVQTYLNSVGYDCGTADGIAGENTTAAIQSYQQANGLEVTGVIDDTLLQSMGFSTASSEDTQSSVESTISATVLYSSDSVSVSASLSADGSAVEYLIDNASVQPVVVYPCSIVADDITLAYTLYDDSYGFAWQLERDMGLYGEDSERFNQYAGIYVESGSSMQVSRALDLSSMEMLGYDQVLSLQLSAAVISLSEPLVFDGTATFTRNNVTSVSFSDLTDIAVSGTSWSADWGEVSGEVLYEDDSIRLLALGIEEAESSDGSARFQLLLENRSDQRIMVEIADDAQAGVNAADSSFASCYISALPGSRGCGLLTLSAEDIASSEDVHSAYCTLILEDQTYTEITRVQYSFGS